MLSSFSSREDAQARAAPYPYPGPSYPSPYYRQDQFMPNYCDYGMQMMASHPIRLVQNTMTLDSVHAPPVSTQNASISQKKKNRWSDTEDRILIELFGDNERKLQYKAFNSPEWQSIATQLKEKCKRENVTCDKTAQQCKNKMANLTKKYKNAKDKLRLLDMEKGARICRTRSLKSRNRRVNCCQGTTTI